MLQEVNNSTWFTEGALPFSEEDINLSVKIDKVIFDKQSDYGHIQIFDTPFFGRILVLDGIIQIANKTEFIYHEMMVTLPSIYHGAPKSMLIVGGGDGGAAKQALQISTIEKIVMVEVDEMIVESCREHLPEISDGALDSDKLQLIIGDGIDYVKNSSAIYDVIVLDVSDPVPGGPAEHLLSKSFYEDVKNRLAPGGVVLMHCGSLIFQGSKSKTIYDNIKDIFPNITMHIALIPEFELTEFGFLVCHSGEEPGSEWVSKAYKNTLSQPCKFLSEDIFWSSKVISPYIQSVSGISNS